MKRIRLNFDAPRAAWRDRLLGRHASAGTRLGGIALLLALGYLAALVAQILSTRQELAGAQLQLRALEPSRAGRVEPTARLSPQERRLWAQVAGQLNTPWASMLSALEQATPEDVALVSIEPDARQRVVRVQAEAKNLDTLLAYAQGLGAVAPFSEAVPLKHETNEQDPNRPVRLSLNLRLRAVPAAARLSEEAAP